MIVVADSSPLIVLVNIGHIQILPTLFREVVIPPQIAAGLADSKRPQTVQDFIREKPVWLRVQAPASVESMPELHERRARGHLPGETSCTPISCSSTKATAGPRRSRGTWQSPEPSEFCSAPPNRICSIWRKPSRASNRRICGFHPDSSMRSWRGIASGRWVGSADKFRATCSSPSPASALPPAAPA